MHLFILIVVNSFICFALFILFVRTVWSLGSNITTIESWEIERHQTLVRRARYFGGFLDGPGGAKIRIKKQEFPYDIGIWANTKAGMGGSRNVSSCSCLTLFLHWFLNICVDSWLVLAIGGKPGPQYGTGL